MPAVKTQLLNVFFLPDLVSDGALLGGHAVVIDILRATTTITTALANGAQRIVPCVDIDQAHLTKARLLGQITGKQRILLGGERQGKPLPGFDLGNSPPTYSPEVVAGNTIVMTTTNGTRAMDMCRDAEQIIIGSFANFSAVAKYLANCEKVSLVCSGTNRHVTCEDVLFAGALGNYLAPDDLVNNQAFAANDQARLAISYWRQLHCKENQTCPTTKQIHQVFEQSLGGSNLIAQDRSSDLEFAALIDRFDNLPILNKETWEITNQ